MYAHVESLETRKLLSSNLVADFGGIYPTDAVTLNNVSYFTANDGKHGRELWRSDGTTGGTKLVKDLVRGARGSMPVQLHVVGNSLLFFITNKEGEVELYKTDGTGGGTQRLLNFGVGNQFDTPDSMSTVYNEKLVFVMHRGTAQDDAVELWTSDGTADGTTMIRHMYTDSGSSIPWGKFHVIGDRLAVVILSAMWSTDGTADGTEELIPVDDNVHVNGEIEHDGKLLFINDRDLWISDGTEEGTHPIKRIELARSNLIPTDDGFVFITQSGQDDNRFLLWETDGTSAGTHVLHDMDPLWGSGGEYQIAGNYSIFAAHSDGETNQTSSIWSVNQTTGALTKLLELGPGAETVPAKLTATGNKAFFMVNQYDNLVGKIVSRQLWESDGTPGGTKFVQDFTQEGANPYRDKIDALREAGEPIPHEYYDRDRDAVSLSAVNGMLAIITTKQTYLMDPVTMSVPQGPAQGYARIDDGILRIFGTRSDDTLRIYAMQGNEDRLIVDINGSKRSFLKSNISRIIVYGYAGDDSIKFSETRGLIKIRSRIWAGNGDDSISCGAGRDSIYGEGGDDQIASGRADDLVDGDAGDDTISAGAGNDTANGGSGADSVIGGAGSDVISGGDDDSEDYLDGGRDQDVVFGQAVYDIFYKPAGDTGSIVDDVLMN